jgi:hypothetical protein
MTTVNAPSIGGHISESLAAAANVLQLAIDELTGNNKIAIAATAAAADAARSSMILRNICDSPT